MPSYQPPALTTIANLALQLVGNQPITDIDDQNDYGAIQCANAIWQTIREVGRAHQWNCLKQRRSLAALTLPANTAWQGGIGWNGIPWAPPFPCPPYPTTPPPYWEQNTAYQGGTLVIYGEAIYYCLMTYVSGNNFIVDMSGGYWAQLYSSFWLTNPSTGVGGYEWNFAYALPQDYLLLTELNGTSCWPAGRGIGELYEIFVVQTSNPANQSISNALALFCNAPYANIKYTSFIQDTTIYDPLYINCVSVLLGSKIATPLRGDGGKLSAELEQKYLTETLPFAMLKDAGERKDRRYDPTRESNFLRSRSNSTNG